MTSSARISAIAAFCKELRQAREYQRMTLPEVAGITRVRVDYLAAIEEGRWEEIPRAYTRGYLSVYAEAVGMNRDKVIKSFDRLMMPETESDAAVFDDAPPLLKEPQAVGVTRAKIRTSWFAVLSRNRKLLYFLSLLSVIALLGLLYVTRKIEDRTNIPVLSFGDAVAENHARVTSPLTTLPLDPNTPNPKGPENWIVWIGNSKGWLIARRDNELVYRWHYDAYDTIKIQYLTALNLRSFPLGSGVAFRDTSTAPIARSSAGDTAVYIIKAGSQPRPDSLKTSTDSIAKG